MKTIIILIFTLSLCSCSSTYFVGETTEPTKLYSVTDTVSSIAYTIPTGTTILIQRKLKKYHYVIIEGYRGYIYNPGYKNYHKYNSELDGVIYGYTTVKPAKKNSYTSNSSTPSGGSVNVKGYYRKNGTYVSPHTRSSPKSSKRK